MTYCVLPGCFRPANPDTHRVCQNCGSKLLLRERYRPLAPVGRGGFGRTFLAVDEDMPSKPHCIVKQLCLDQPSSLIYAKAVDLFHQEAVRLDELGNHPQIPTLLAHFEQNRLLYLVQEFIEGQTLADELQQQGTFTEPKLVALLRDLLPTLQFIHDRQVIHRDIKPSNIIRRQQDQRLVLIDFGIAKLIPSKTSLKTGTVVGTAEFMAPEQNRGKVFPASDLYSLAVVGIHLLTGLSPFDLFDDANDCWIWRDRLSSKTPISGPLGQILDKMLEAAVKHRFQSATEVLQALEQRTQPKSGGSSPATPIKTVIQPITVQPTGLGTTGLESEVGMDYQRLKTLLGNEQWQKADAETWRVLRLLLNKPPYAFVFSGELRRIPCQDLQTIDQLWTLYSRGRFGFSVQGHLYQILEQDYGAFCDRVGWPTHNQQDHNFPWQFERSAPMGHLPTRSGLGGQQWWRHVGVMTARLQDCNG